HTCAVATNHWAYCWGYGAGGRLGNNSSTQRETPVAIVNGQIPSGRSIRQVSGGAEHTCAVASDNQAYCWGAGGNGRLGNGATSNQSTPRSVLQGESPTGSTIKEVRAGRYTTCAV